MQTAKTNRMKQWIFRLWYFSKGDTRAALLLIGICFFVLMGPSLLKKQFRTAQQDHPEWRNDLLAEIQKLEKKKEIEDTLQPFNFDPNEVSLENLLEMNFPKGIARTIIRYREKGGQFRKKEDLQKIYGLDSTMYALLEPYIQVPQKASFPKRAKNSSKSWNKPSFSQETIDVNQASQKEWQQFYGIGPVLSGRIIKFKEALGGFGSVDQVGETYGLEDSIFQQIRPFLTLQAKPQQINLNHCKVETLAAHPYISWKLARRIISYRQQHGVFSSIDDLSGIQALPEDFFVKVVPYLTVEGEK